MWIWTWRKSRVGTFALTAAPLPWTSRGNEGQSVQASDTRCMCTLIHTLHIHAHKHG
uniref:Uncharacterized protein n=1 Tax=Anguilla anguilla TaxID=7936 RepID=A0A0E9V729_ANGAN